MKRFAVLLFGLLAPAFAFACGAQNRKECYELVRELVAHRSQAIEHAFGDVLGVLPRETRVKFVSPGDPLYQTFDGRIAYDPSSQALVVPKRLARAKLPKPMTWASAYWPYYKNPLYQKTFPIIGAIDGALWGAFLQEAARARGLMWPHAECGALALSKRLPCEMTLEGVQIHVTELNVGLFNVNRLDRIFPENFAEFERRVWRRDEPAYRDVRRYGGIMLLKPIIAEFGVPNALTYVAQNPFRIEENNLQLSARRYQERAREVIANFKPVDRVAKAPIGLEPNERILITAQRATE